MSLTAEQMAALERIAPTPESVLGSSRVDLIEMRRAGIPERQYVAGSANMLPAAKRVHISAEKKTGKSLAIGVCTAVEIVAAGGTVIILDRENGADEYARRLDDVLSVRGADRAFEELIRTNCHYHAWPALRLEWAEDPTYPEAFARDVAIFDGSRSHLTPLGLKEDQSDDYAKFVTSLIDPLMRAGTTTVVLDNMGHEAKERARGSSAKEDLADIAFTLRKKSPFSSSVTGRLELICTHSRIGEQGERWEMALGGGVFDRWSQIRAKPPQAREDLRAATVEALSAAHPEVLSQNKLIAALRERGLKFTNTILRDGLAAWVCDPKSGIETGPEGGGYRCVGMASTHPRVETPPTHPDAPTNGTAQTSINTGDIGASKAADAVRRGGASARSHPFRGDAPDPASQNGSADDVDLAYLEDLAATYSAEQAERAG